MQCDGEDLMARHVPTLPLMTADPKPAHTRLSFHHSLQGQNNFNKNDSWYQQKKDVHASEVLSFSNICQTQRSFSELDYFFISFIDIYIENSKG